MAMTPLQRLIRDEIAARGPMPLGRYMALCLGHPDHGYYMRKVPFGQAGDFTTAPEISQVFGELIGLWAADLWLRAGRPARVHLVELGPGRGTLMADAWRATARVPGFHAAADIHFVEMSPVLRAEQAARLPHARWHADWASLPADAPLLIVANEFIDALPIERLVLTDAGWAWQAVDARADGTLAFVPGHPASADDLAPLAPLLADAAPGEVLELCPAGQAVAADIAGALARVGGAALLIDYGHATRARGDTLQALARHQFADPLVAPGEADITAHVDFQALVEAAQAAGARTLGPVTQGRFLRQLGLDVRTAQLAKANPPRAEALVMAARRLADPEEMGTLFKVLALVAPQWPTPLGFDT